MSLSIQADIDQIYNFDDVDDVDDFSPEADEVGQTIEHSKFGKGTIIDISPHRPITLLGGKIIESAPMLLRVDFGPDRTFWLPNENLFYLYEQNKNRQDLCETLWRYPPDARPTNHEPVELFSRFPSSKYLFELAEIGYSLEAVLASVSSCTFLHRRRDDRRGATTKNIRQPSHIAISSQLDYIDHRTAKRAGKAIRKAASGMLSEEMFSRVLSTTRHDLPMQSALRETLLLGRTVKSVARERGLSTRALRDATRAFRKKAALLTVDALNPFFVV